MNMRERAQNWCEAMHVQGCSCDVEPANVELLMREGFAAGAKAQREAYAEYFFGDELYVSKILKLPLVTPPEEPEGK